jgi:sulfide:quinone oxidoreductase
MKTHYQIVIVGGGNAGISLAAQLLRKDKKLDIAIVEPSEKHYYQPAWTLVGGGDYDVRETVRAEADFIPEGATWLKEAVVKLDPDNNTVETDKGNRYTYDYLIVCPGIQLDWHKIKGLEGYLGKNGIASNYSYETAPYTFECIKSLKKGKAIFTQPITPIKCGGAPQKITYLACDYWRKQGVLKDIDVHFYTGGSVIFGVKKYAQTLEKVAKRYGVKLHFLHNLIEIDPINKKVVFEVYKDGKVVDHVTDTYDIIHVTPPQSAPDFIKNSPLAVPNNPLGWVDVDKHNFQHVRYPNVYSIGDASSLPTSKTGAAIRKQVPILVEHLLSRIRFGKLADSKYDGYASCPLVTGYGKLVLAEFDYNNQPKETFPFDQSKERWTMYQLKRHILPWMYWNLILRGKA